MIAPSLLNPIATNRDAAKTKLSALMNSTALIPRTTTPDLPSITRASAHGYSGVTSFSWNSAGAANIIKGAQLTDVSGVGYWFPASGAPNQYFVEFWHTGTDFALRFGPAASSSGFYQVWVDGHPMTQNPVYEVQADVGVNVYQKFNWGTAKSRFIRLLVGGFMGFITAGSFYMPASNYIYGAPTSRFRVAMPGDSYVAANHNAETGPPVVRPMGLAQHLALKTGWEVYSIGVGSTGYAVGSPNHYGSTGRLAHLATLPADLGAIIVWGSTNDWFLGATSAATAAAATAYYAALAAARPNVPVIVVGPAGMLGMSDMQLAEYTLALKNAALAAPNVAGFIDMQQPSKWLTGTSGNATAPAGNGNRDIFLGVDGVHYSPTGADYLASRLVEALRPIKI